MTLIEFIGFIITMFAMFFLLFRRAWEQKKMREHPEEYEAEIRTKEEALRKILQTMEIEMEEEDFEEEEEVLPPPPPPKPQKPQRTGRLVRDSYELEAKLDDYTQYRGVEDRHLELEISQDRYRDLGAHVVTPDLFLQTEHVGSAIPTTRIHTVINDLTKKRNLLIYHDVLAPPRGFQKRPWHDHR